jgi:2-iminobutanoate/2-iminopropanoate deaminase
MPPAHQAIHTSFAPSAIGPYSQAIVAAPGALVFLSGQVGLSPHSGQLVADEISAQTEQVLDNLAAVLRAAGCGFADVVKTTVYLVDLADFATVNALYGRRFPDGAPPPARATVQVAALPRAARVEIDAIAVRPS